MRYLYIALLFLSLVSYSLCFYIPKSGVPLPSFQECIGALAMASIVTAYIQTQLPQRGQELASILGKLSILILFTPFLASLISLPWMMCAYWCAPLAVSVFMLFSRFENFSLFERINTWLLHLVTILYFVYTAGDAYPYFDAWQINSLAQSFAGDFYYMDFIRQGFIDSHYAIGFPYFLPFLTFIAYFLSGWDIFSYLIINFTFLLIGYFFIRKIFTLLHIAHLWSLAALLCLAVFIPSYEIQAGGSTSLIFTLLTALLYFLLYFERKGLLLANKSSFLIGMLLGVGVMIRFDFVAFVAVALFFYFLMCLTYKKWSPFFIIMQAFILCLLPWIVYSLSHFDQFFITDNSRRIINIQNTTPYSYFTSEYTTDTLFSHPMAWLKNLLFQFSPMLKELLAYLSDFAFVILITVCLCVYAIREKQSLFAKRSNWPIFALLICGMSVILLLLAVHYLWNCRYYSPYLSLYIISALLLMRSMRRKVLLSLSCVVLGVMFYDIYRNVEFKIPMLTNYIKVPDKSFLQHRKNVMQLSKRAVAIADYIKSEDRGARICLPGTSNHLDAAHFFAQSGIAGTLLPDNIVDMRHLQLYLRDFGISFVYADRKGEHAAVDAAIEAKLLAPTRIEYLYYVDFKDES